MTSLSSVQAFGREAMQTQPEPDEAEDIARAAVRQRNARDAMLLVSSAAFLFAIIALVSWQIARQRPRPTSVASAPPPIATIAPPVVVSVHSADNHVQIATSAAASNARPAHPKSIGKR